MIPLRAYAIAAGVVASLIALWWVYEGIKEAGRQETLTTIERQDRSAADAAKDARTRRTDCVATGGVWDTSSGQCSR